MENHKRKRGISLIHHQRNNSANTMLSFDQTHQRPEGPKTHFCYPRYPITLTTSRHASAPKPAVSFSYNVQQERSLVPTPIEIRECELEKSQVYSVSHVLKSFNRIQRPECDKVEKESTLQQYQSFEQCKQVIGKRLFGDSTISENKHPVQRVNRFQPLLHVNSCLLNDSNLNITANSLQVSRKTILTPIQEEKKSTQNKELSISNIENISIKPDPKPKEVDIIKKTKRDPINLNEMERRLKEIIKICDEHI